MFENLFGAEMPLAVRFFLAFLIVLGLIGATAWAVRRFGAGRLGGSTSRGRQPRLAVIDYASVDARRRLLLVRRDNVEHLLLIGGPTDVVVEANIVRAVAATRDAQLPREGIVPRAPAMESPRPLPLPDNGSSGSWPLQPDPAAALRSGPRIETVPEEPAAWPLQPSPDVPARPQRETLAALADELSIRSASPRNRNGASARSAPAEPRPETRPPRVQPAAAEPSMSNDQNLAEMAHRLEAALRKPNTTADARDGRDVRPPPRTVAPPEPAPVTEDVAPSPPPAPPQRNARVVEPKQQPARAETKPQPGQSKALYDSLEQEMASLLGRPTSKT